jgi:hypothetical protein
MLFANHRRSWVGDQHDLSTADLVGVFLHGAVSPTAAHAHH